MKTLLFGGLRVKDSRKKQFARCTWEFSNADEIRPPAACSAEKVIRPSQWAEASSSESSKSKSRFYRTIHLEVMPDSNAGLDGITMRGVLSISFSQEVGMLRKAWIIGISAAMASPFYVPPEAVGMPANHGRWPERAHRFSESNCASCPKPCKRNDCSIVGPERLLLRDSKRLESG